MRRQNSLQVIEAIYDGFVNNAGEEFSERLVRAIEAGYRAGSIWDDIAQTLIGLDLGVQEQFELIEELYKSARANSVMKESLTPPWSPQSLACGRRF